MHPSPFQWLDSAQPTEIGLDAEPSHQARSSKDPFYVLSSFVHILLLAYQSFLNHERQISYLIFRDNEEFPEILNLSTELSVTVLYLVSPLLIEEIVRLIDGRI